MNRGNVGTIMRSQPRLMATLVLIIIAALAYLPLINKIGYTHDDWYLMSSAETYGPAVFHPIYSVDRPLRAYMLEAAYGLFGGNVVLYNLSAWVFRVLSALFFLWLLEMLWPNRTRWTFLMALFYLIYPGFLSQQNGIDYQSQLLSLALATLSLALTAHTFFVSNPWLKISEIVVAILFGMVYLGLVEYEVGFELIRLMIIFLLAARAVPDLRGRILATMKAWLPYLLIFLGFGGWRVFFFQSERGATDVNLQFENLRLYPVQTVFHWAVQVAQDLFDVILSAWVIPFSQLASHIQGWGLFIAIAVAGVVIFILIKLYDRDVPLQSSAGSFTQEALWLGLLGAVAGLIPIAMVNREVAFPSFSRYSLVSSVGVAIFIVAVLTAIRGRTFRIVIASVLVLIAMLTHHANSVQFAQETAVVQNFWWQLSWRIPQLAQRTTLIGNYPTVAIEEDYFVWGPANLIYYPKEQISESMGPAIFAAVLNKSTVEKVLAKERQEFDNRKNIITYKNYRNILILSQPDIHSCVHVINGLQPEFSDWELDAIREIGPFSEVEHIQMDETAHTPPTIVFGPEPLHGWCYYYQKADLARQRGNWREVVEAGDEAFKNDFAPNDVIEWMPFLQAYVMTDNIDRLRELAPVVRTSPYVARQACQILTALPDLSATVQKAVHALYCAQ